MFAPVREQTDLTPRWSADDASSESDGWFALSVDVEAHSFRVMSALGPQRAPIFAREQSADDVSSESDGPL